MTLRRGPGLVLVLVPLALLIYSLLSLADSEQDTSMVSGVPQPVIPRGAGDHCVEATDFMRRNHMTLLRHQRDDTVHQGIRTRQHSLKECISCHAVAGPDGMALTVSSPKHFCRTCHDYAAVTIDCFECHASRPTGPAPDGHGKSLPGAE